jgi:hypothetical protein
MPPLDNYFGDTFTNPYTGGESNESGQTQGAGESAGAGAGAGESGEVKFAYEIYIPPLNENLIIGESGYTYSTRELARDDGVAFAKGLQIGREQVNANGEKKSGALIVIVKPDKAGFNTSEYNVPEYNYWTTTGPLGENQKPPENPSDLVLPDKGGSVPPEGSTGFSNGPSGSGSSGMTGNKPKTINISSDIWMALGIVAILIIIFIIMIIFFKYILPKIIGKVKT